MSIINPGMNKWDYPVNKMGMVGKSVSQERLELTRQFIEEAHYGYEDKTGDEFWKHPYRVGLRIMEVPGITEADIHAALLHDIVEDTRFTLEDLWQIGYPWHTLTLIDTLTRDKSRLDRGETYQQWIEWICNYGSWQAKVIKVADILDNIWPSRHEGLDSKTATQINHLIKTKYNPALSRLQKSLDKKLFNKIISGDL